MNQGTRITVTVQLWEQIKEGVKTADAGYSLHPHEEDRQAFLKEYWKTLPEDPPRVFSRPVIGDFYRTYVDTEVYNDIRQNLHGKRFEGVAPEKCDDEPSAKESPGDSGAFSLLMHYV